MDTLTDTEIDGIWTRVKNYIDLNEITALDVDNQQDQLDRAMNITTKNDNATQQANMDYLKEMNFPSVAVKNKKIRAELNEKAKGAYVEDIKKRFDLKKETGTETTIKGKKYLVFRGYKKGGSGRFVFAGLKRL